MHRPIPVAFLVLLEDRVPGEGTTAGLWEGARQRQGQERSGPNELCRGKERGCDASSWCAAAVLRQIDPRRRIPGERTVSWAQIERLGDSGD